LYAAQQHRGSTARGHHAQARVSPAVSARFQFSHTDKKGSVMRVADYVIGALGAAGIDRIFVVYGAANGDLIDAFTRVHTTKYVAVMHEQAGGFAAEGYAKIKGVPGAAIATSGPGGHNLLTAMGNCFYDSVPCVFLTGQINSQFLRPDPSLRQVGFQETDIVGMATPVTKYAKLVLKAEDIRYEVEKALYLTTAGRPGPVLLDIPLDVQKREIDPARLHGFDRAQAAVPRADAAMVDAAIGQYLADLAAAERPVLMIGGGVRSAGAVDAVLELGEVLGIPVFPTWNALDIVPSDYRNYGGRIGTYGGAGRNFGIQNSDLLLAIGSRISGRITGGNVHSFARAAKKYVVDVDPALLQRHLQQVPFDVNILSDARDFTERLLARARDVANPSRHGGWLRRVLDWKTRYDPVRPEFFRTESPVHPYAFVRTLSKHLRADDIIVGDCGGNLVVTSHAFETKRGQRFFTNNGNSPMGFSFAGAMGAWFAAPHRRVICLIGDGGMNMNIQELQTFVNYGVAVKTFILNNHIYGITKAYQETNFQGRAEACGPKGYHPPDFRAVAAAYGVASLSIGKTSDMDAKIAEVLDSSGPLVCDVDMHEYHSYEPRIFGWKTPIEDMYPYLPREEFRANMLIEPLPDWQSPAYPDNARPVVAQAAE
jgi:acetolactate synthase-1/2/3 large subunit